MYHQFMTHPLCCWFVIDILLETIVYVFEIFSISGRTTAVVRLHNSCYALAHQVMCMRCSAVVYALSHSSMALAITSKLVVGSKRATTCPFLLMRNLVKFHLISALSL